MAEQNGTHGFLDTVGLAFMARRLRNHRVRAAAVRELKAARTPRLSTVIMVVGSRGDVQPFIPIGRRLAKVHRVRIATHREFRPLVEQAGLEFYPLAGDPHELMEYMVKTRGRVVPRLDHMVEDVPRKRALIAEILASTWRACTEADPDRLGAPAFRADAILSNPVSFGHIHCAEALHVPLHMIFTMPWSPTSAYPHPFWHVASGENHPVQNFLSYGLMDLLIWSGIGDLVNTFRRDTLHLPPLSLVDGASLLEDNEVPFTYLWPASLLPKPADWGPHIDLANFTFYEQADTYEPPRALLDFLAAGEAPMYVGFGSVAVDNTAAVTRTILTAIEKAGVRAIVSEGWAHLGGETPPPNVFLIGDTPHDWLFPRCRAVCHHGGAGTTATGLRAGLPTVVVPSFGDQFFWGQVVANAGAGPEPIPIDRLDSTALAKAFAICDRPQTREHARAVGARIRETDGVELVVQSVYRQLPTDAIRRSNDADAPGTRPAFHVDWSARPDRGVVGELGELMTDAAKALKAGLNKLVGL
jgi:sterol 3beta-glucosyltransferase